MRLLRLTSSWDQASRGADITVHGSGNQTRAEIFVSDLADGIAATIAHPEAKGHIINLAGAEFDLGEPNG